MPKPSWPRIFGAKFMPDGQGAFVLIAENPNNKGVHVLWAERFEREVMTVQAQALKDRGAWVPLAYYADPTDKEMVTLLEKHGIRLAPYMPDEMVKFSDPMIEQLALRLWELMRTKSFVVDPDCKQWIDEYKTFERQGEKIPKDNYPLMMATMIAVGSRQFARSQSQHDKMRREKNFPRLSIA